MKPIYLSLLLLSALVGRAQTWPDKTCIDRPYVSGRSDSIYHTNNCVIKDSISFSIGTGYITEPKIECRYFFHGRQIECEYVTDSYLKMKYPITTNFQFPGSRWHDIVYDKAEYKIVWRKAKNQPTR